MARYKVVIETRRTEDGMRFRSDVAEGPGWITERGPVESNTGYSAYRELALRISASCLKSSVAFEYIHAEM